MRAILGANKPFFHTNTTTQLGFCDQLQKQLLFFSTMFTTTWSQKLLRSCKGHQDAMWHHGFAIIVNMITCSNFW
jgi:hypothetical protein